VNVVGAVLDVIYINLNVSAVLSHGNKEEYLHFSVHYLIPSTYDTTSSSAAALSCWLPLALPVW
jgi:hypothetical protein